VRARIGASAMSTKKRLLGLVWRASVYFDGERRTVGHEAEDNDGKDCLRAAHGVHGVDVGHCGGGMLWGLLQSLVVSCDAEPEERL
jgi:hypothetical protein